MLKSDMDYLKNQLPATKYRYSKIFDVLPGYKIDNNF